MALSNHLRWKPILSPWISTTCSLLWAFNFARYKTLLGERNIRISLISSGRIPKEDIFPSTYLVKAYVLEKTKRPWHDDPEGEYLVAGTIPVGAILATVAFQDLSQQFEELLPEL